MNFDWNNIIFAAIAIVGLTEYVKSLDKGEALKKLYPYIPLVFSFLAGFILTMIANGFDVWNFLFYSIINISISTLGYKTIVKLVDKKIQQIKKKSASK